MSANSSYYNLNNKYNVLEAQIQGLTPPPAGGYIPKNTTGNLTQTVSGNYNLTSSNLVISNTQMDVKNNLLVEGDIILNPSSHIDFNNGTSQNSAYTGYSTGSTVSYTNTNLTFDSNGKITSASNGSGGGGGVGLASNNVFTGTNTFSNTVTTNSTLNANSALNANVGLRVGTNTTGDYLAVQAPIYAGSVSTSYVDPMEYKNDITLSTNLDDNSIMSKKYIDSKTNSSASISVTNLTASNTTTTQTLQVNGNTTLGDGVGTDITSINGTINGATSTAPMAYTNTVTTFTGNTQNIPSIAYTNSNYASLANDNTLAGNQTITGVVQGNTGATLPISYPSGVSVSNITGNQNLTSKAYVDSKTNSSSNLSVSTLTTSGLITSGNGLTVSTGSVSLPSNSINDSALSTNVPLLNAVSNTFTGSGSFVGLTVPSGSVSLPSHSINDSALSTNVPLLNAVSNTFTGSGSFVGLTVPSGSVSLPSHSINDSALSTNVPLLNAVSNTFTGSGSFVGLTVPSGSVSLPSHSINDSALSTNVPLINASSNTFTGSLSCTTLSCSSETDTGTLTTTGLLSANGGLNTTNMSASGTVQGTNSTTPISYISTITASTITSAQHLTSKAYVDNAISTIGGPGLASNNIFTGTNTFSNILNANNGLTVNSNIIASSTGVVWGKNYREKTAPVTINTAGTVYTIDWLTSGVNTLNTAPTANFTLNVWNITLSSTQTNVMTLNYLNTGKFYPTTINAYSDSGTTLITISKYWLGGTPTIASAYSSILSLSFFQAGTLDGTSNNICQLTLGNCY